MGRIGRRGLAALVAALALLASWEAGRLSAQQAERRPGPPRVLLLGDSVMDQQGSAAALLLRQAGFAAVAHGAWGTGLLTREQYDFGRTVYTAPRSKQSWDWLIKGREYVDEIRPDLVVVYLDHNYWPPAPRDASGREITDLHTAAGQQMIATQARAFIAILRSHGARVAFVTPVPQTQADPAADNAIWHAYLPVLRAERVTIIDIRPALTDANGRRVETEADCTGAPTLVRPPGDLHLTRYGASRSGTRLATASAALFGRTLHGAPAPGDHTTTLVLTATGKGYWSIGCDGGVYAFGDARRIMSPALPAGVRVVGAVRASRGLWLVTSDGRVLSTGGAPALRFGAGAGAPLVAAAGTADGRGILATTAQGQVLAAGTAVAAGGAERVGAAVVGIATDPASGGYWLVGANGTVVARGGAGAYGSANPFASAPVTGITASTTGRGYLLVRADGRVAAFGDARAAGNAPHPPLEPGTLSVLAPTQPSVAIVRATAGGYWIVDDNGAVRPFAGAPSFGGTGNLALFTP